ncbi:MAG: glycerophosphodiester phosphodiesterase family protein [Nocardioides sp.]|uniref:glycerophosphodiester phosphodiesterase family protein n=1 Tax=Nocardioides sp. TaxID=35761 RepID=UPI003F0D454B
MTRPRTGPSLLPALLLVLALLVPAGGTPTAAAEPVGVAGAAPTAAAAPVFTPPKRCTKLRGKARQRCVRKARAAWLRTQERRCVARGGWWIGRTCWTNPSRRTGITAYEGGSALAPTATLAAYRNSLALGVSSVHAPVRVTADGALVLSGTDTVSSVQCLDAAPVTVGDPDYPYVGKPIAGLDLAQVRAVECGTRTDPDRPAQVAAPGSRVPTLDELFRTITHQAPGTRVDVEVAPLDTAGRQALADGLAEAFGSDTSLAARTQVSSSDWTLLTWLRQQPGLGSLTTVGIDGGGRTDPIAAVTRAGLQGWSPVRRHAGREYMTLDRVRAAHAAGLRVVSRPTTSATQFRDLVLRGVDEVITTRPDLARTRLAAFREPLPTPYPDPDAGARPPLPRAHAHNDYEHTRPLLDALDAGFTSVEADIFLRDGELYVAHEATQIRPERTLEALYLAPLEAQVENGTVRGRGLPFQLLVDIKDDGLATYQALETALAAHPGLFSQYAPTRTTAPVDVVVSGSSPLAHMQAQQTRWIGYDGSPAQSGTLAPDLMPLVSQSWALSGMWSGSLPMTAAEQQRVVDLVTRAHQGGHRIRFWLTNDWSVRQRNAIWTALHDLGYDHLNADDLDGLATFMANRDPGYLAS